MKIKQRIYFLVFCSLLISACHSRPTRLPILGFHKYVEKTVDGKKRVDTIYHKIDDFMFLDQDSAKIDQSYMKNKVYVADFFFTTCPDICPLMTKNMLLVYEKYKDRNNFKILSHSIDPFHDSIPVLKAYEQNLGLANQNTWHFLYGPQEKVFEIAKNSYLATAKKDQLAPRGVIHSGVFVLIDRKRRIRGIYDGTTIEGAEKLIHDIPFLLDKDLLDKAVR